MPVDSNTRSDSVVTDCGPDGGCEDCDVCRYLNFLEWAGQASSGVPSIIERDPVIEAYLSRTYPEQFPTPPALEERRG